MASQAKFSSRLVATIAMIGVAVGLGNVWRFPYMMGKYGGSAFLFIYLIFTLVFAIPALMAEFGLGRATSNGPLGAFPKAFGKSIGRLVGVLLFFSLLMATSYYVIVIGNLLHASYFSIVYSFNENTISSYSNQLENGWLQYTMAVGCIVFSLFVVGKGLKKGIELVSKIFVPFFLITILYLIFSAFSIPGAFDQLIAFLQPDFSALEAQHIFAALGQSFYSLSLGGTFMLTYGSYLKKEERLVKVAGYTAFGDLSAALLTALFIVPTILVFGLDMTSGPQLIFKTLPRLFEQMPAGHFVGSVFLFALTTIAILSLVSAYEVMINGWVSKEGLNWTKRRALISLGLIEIIICIPTAHFPQLIGWLDLIFGSGMQVLGSGLAVLALCWGLGKSVTLKQLQLSPQLSNFFFFWLKYVIPAVLFVILLGYIINTI